MAKILDIPRFLKQVPLFHGLSEKDVVQVSRITQLRHVEKAETIFSKSSRGDTLYIVVDGLVKIFSESRTGKSKTFAYLDSTDFFGEMALLERGERSATAVAMSASTLLTIRRHDFQKIVKARPELAFALLRTLCARLRRADHDIESLSFNSVSGRLARILLDLAKRHGRAGHDGTRIALELSHQELADMAGTAREMVTRVLNGFVRTKCLRMDSKVFTLTNPRMLRDWIF